LKLLILVPWKLLALALLKLLALVPWKRLILAPSKRLALVPSKRLTMGLSPRRLAVVEASAGVDESSAMPPKASPVMESAVLVRRLMLMRTSPV
jgi:hypothetical protein